MLKNIIIGIAVIIVLGFFLFIGYKIYPRIHPCLIKSDTILIYDTIDHYIPNDIHHYHSKLDTVIYHDTIFKDVDTAEILKDYFALHFISREWKDSLIIANLKDEISENKILNSNFSYKILRPQKVINNVINNYSYSKYLYITTGMNIKKAESLKFGVSIAFKRVLVGGEYYPLLNTFGFNGGIRIAKFR